jgi:pimeloyl-ACP methyl ester carboxylesterase
MMKRNIEFSSKGVTCRGWLITPDKGNGPFPTLIMAGGWCYTKEIVMPDYADFFTREGVACLLFDYRNFGESDGMPRQHLDPWMQIADYRNAISFAETLQEVDANRIGIWGISYSGGHVLIAGALDSRVRCIVSNIPVVDGYLNLRIGHGEERYRLLKQLLLDNRRKSFIDPEHKPTIPMSVPDPFETLANWPYPAVYNGFMPLKATVAPLHEHWTTMESTELLDAYTVMPYVNRIVNTPTLMLVAENDDLTLWDLEIKVFNEILTPKKKLVVLPDITHMSLYGNLSKLEIAANETIPWLLEHLVKLGG